MPIASRQALTYPQNITLYQVDDQIYEPVEVATTNLFNTFLDALDGVWPGTSKSWLTYADMNIVVLQLFGIR
jgi:hypothetical protein